MGVGWQVFPSIVCLFPKKPHPFITGGHANLFFFVSAVALDRSGKSCPGGLGFFAGEGKALYVLFLGMKNQEIGTSPAFANISRKAASLPWVFFTVKQIMNKMICTNIFSSGVL